jgi:hypothetical protein
MITRANKTKTPRIIIFRKKDSNLICMKYNITVAALNEAINRAAATVKAPR